MLPKFLVADFYAYLRQFLENVEREVWVFVGARDPRQHRRWRRSGRIPFPVLEQVAHYRGVSIYEELEAQQARFAYPYAKYTVQLSFRVTPTLTDTLQYLTPSTQGLVVTTGAFRTTTKRCQEDVVAAAARLFDVAPESFQCYNKRAYVIVNELLRDYVATFFRYETPWTALSPEQLTTLITEWDQILQDPSYQ